MARVGLDGSIRTVAEGLSGSAASTGPIPAAASASPATDRSPSPAATRPRPADVALVRGGNRRAADPASTAELLDTKRARRGPQARGHLAFDSRPIDAWLTLPPDYRPAQRYPLILEIHGGPFAAYGPHFSTDNQLYAAAGYAVLSVNPRGSTSYGEEFANQIHHAYPGHDYDDLMSAVDAAIAERLRRSRASCSSPAARAAACSPPGSSARPTASRPRRPRSR